MDLQVVAYLAACQGLNPEVNPLRECAVQQDEGQRRPGASSTNWNSVRVQELSRGWQRSVRSQDCRKQNE